MNMLQCDMETYCKENFIDHYIHDSVLYVMESFNPKMDTYGILIQSYTSLPNNVVFEAYCSLINTNIDTINQDTLFLGSLAIDSSIKNLPVLNVGRFLFVHAGVCIPYGSYIGMAIKSLRGANYEYINNVKLKGYLVNHGVIS